MPLPVLFPRRCKSSSPTKDSISAERLPTECSENRAGESDRSRKPDRRQKRLGELLDLFLSLMTRAKIPRVPIRTRLNSIQSTVLPTERSLHGVMLRL